MAITAMTLASLLSNVASCQGTPPDSIPGDGPGREEGTLRTDSVSDADSLYSVLPGLDVTAARVSHAPGKSVYIPTRQQRNLSPDAMSLLGMLMIPDISKTADGEYTAVNGSGLTYYINGAPARSQDLEGINTRDVRNVTYLDHPSDARYLGAQYVVEFTVREYEYGGYSKVSGQFYFLGETHFAERLSSKFTYRRMTYDLFAGVQNFRYLCSATRSSEIFHLKDRETTVDRTPLHSNLRAEVYPVQFRAAYSHGRTHVSNEVGFGYNASRESARGTVDLISRLPSSDPDRVSYPYEKREPLKEYSTVWLCDASLDLGKGWAMSASSNVAYTHYSGTYLYESGEPTRIDRRITENSVQATLDAVLRKKLTGHSSLSLKLKGNLLSSHSHYSGDSQYANDFLFPVIAGHVTYSLSFDKVAAAAYAGCAAEWNRLNDHMIRTVYPYGVVNLSYSPDPRLRCSLWMQYSTYSPTSDLRNPTPMQMSGFLWKSGNPDLRPYPKYEIGPSLVWSPTSVLSLSASVNYTRLHDIMRTDYTLIEGGGAVMQSFVNGGDTHVTRAQAMASLSLLRGKVGIMGGPKVTSYRGNGIFMNDLTSFEMVGSAQIYLGNFYARCMVIAGGRSYTSFSMDATIKRKTQYSLSFGWGNSRWTFGAYLNNIFRTSWDNVTRQVDSPVYSSTVTELGLGLRQGVMLSAVYTFGYGKKIDRFDELEGGVGGAQSAILR